MIRTYFAGVYNIYFDLADERLNIYLFLELTMLSKNVSSREVRDYQYLILFNN